MFGRDERRGRVRPAAAVVLPLISLWLSAFPARGQAHLEAGGNGGSAIDRILQQAVRGAEAKLAVPSCGLLFSDFEDLRGHRIQDTLDAMGQTAQSYFRGLVFYDGYGRSPCASQSTIAFTSPGSRAIFICSPQFAPMAHRQPGLVAALLIHEELHSLGLGENPPASKEITARVIARCGK
jgi:hypothetical protein